jgi:hypothetical protein
MGKVKLQDGTVIPIDGVWHLSGNKFCRTWKAGRDAGKEICETWNKAGKNSVHVMSEKKDLGGLAAGMHPYGLKYTFRRPAATLG